MQWTQPLSTKGNSGTLTKDSGRSTTHTKHYQQEFVLLTKNILFAKSWWWARLVCLQAAKLRNN